MTKRNLIAGTFVALVSALLLKPAPGFASGQSVPVSAGGAGIQQMLDRLGPGGHVILKKGTYVVREPIILDKDGQSLTGEGSDTTLFLADGANCPLLILGPPKEKITTLTHGLYVADLILDGNRIHQQREHWKVLRDGVIVNNNGIHVGHVDNAVIEHVTCKRCRSGGIVSTGESRRLIIHDYTAYDNYYDGLACYRTEDSHFSQLNLHHNLGAGISLDLDFDHNIIDGAVLWDNDLGIFMRQSHDNLFESVTIRHCLHDGVFMAQTGEWSSAGWWMIPATECTGNAFDNLRVTGCGGRAFRVNDADCTNNTINRAEIWDNAEGISQPPSHPLIVNGLSVNAE